MNGEYAPSKFTIYGKDSQMVFNIFRGMLYLTVYNRDKKRVFNKQMNPTLTRMFRVSLEKIQKDQPGTIIPIVVSSWDRATKQSQRDWVLKIIKTDNLIYTIEVSDKDGTHQMPLMADGKVTMGSDPVQERTRSEVGIGLLIEWLVCRLPIALELTNRAYQPPGKGGNSGSNNGGNRPNGGGSDNGGNRNWDDNESAF